MRHQTFKMGPGPNYMLTQRKAGFEDFYNELIPALVDFVQKIGIKEVASVV